MFRKPNYSFMPENIFKLYRPSTNNKDKSWHNEPEQDRFEHVQTALSRYCDNKKDYDYLDLVWSIKNAVVGDIFFSEDVYLGIQQGLYWKQYIGIDQNGVIFAVKTPETDQFKIIKGIIERKTLQVNREFDDTFLEIRKWTGNNYSGVSGNSDKALVFEHVIPAKRYIRELIEQYKKGVFDQSYFKEFRNKIAVCIITKRQDESLNENHLREDMPPGWTWHDNPFERYKRAGIVIHEKETKPSPHGLVFM